VTFGGSSPACHDAAVDTVDTVEWGTQEPVTRPPGRLRSVVAATGGRRAGAVLAVVGVAVLIAAELLPWATLHLLPGATSAGLSPGTGFSFGRTNGDLVIPDPAVPSLFTVGLDRLDSGTALVYRLGTVLLLAMVGAALLARPAQRRTALGLGLGVLAGQLVVVAGMVHSFGTVVPTSATGEAFRSPPVVTSTALQSGTLCAFVSLALLLAALLASALPDRVRARLVGGVAEPAAERSDEEPMDLTVEPASPLGGAYFGRPDGRQR
jgi:hypothetical protein